MQNWSKNHENMMNTKNQVLQYNDNIVIDFVKTIDWLTEERNILLKQLHGREMMWQQIEY